MIELIYNHRINKDVVRTTKGIISVETLISASGRDICIFLERLTDNVKFSQRYNFLDFKNKPEVILHALKEFGQILG